MTKTEKIEPQDPYWYAKMVGWASVIMGNVARWNKSKGDRQKNSKQAKEWLTSFKEHDEMMMARYKK